MVTAGFEIEHLTVDHVGNQREWMPVVRLGVGKRTRQAAPTQSYADKRIPVDISFVVVVNEIVAQRLTKHDPNKDDYGSANRSRGGMRRFFRLNCRRARLHADRDSNRLLRRRFTK